MLLTPKGRSDSATSEARCEALRATEASRQVSRLRDVSVLSVVGNRPQFIKSAPLSVALRRSGVEEVLVHSGQHYDPELSQVFFDELGLDEPRHELGLRTAETSLMERAIARVVVAERPELVIVFGDTNSTLAGARAALAAGVPVAHVEAGLRSGDLSMPEERNRIEVDRLASILLAPDERSRKILSREGVTGRIEVVGDVMADACLRFAPLGRERHPPPHPPGTYVLATIHREANVFQPRLGRIAAGLSSLDEPVIFPAHPRTRAELEREQIRLGANVELVAPLAYLELASTASQARVIVTDSGGLQKEAYWYGVPCVTTRPSTEWIDTVELGANTLVDDDPAAIAAAVAAARIPQTLPLLYGDGHAAERIAAVLLATMRGL
jgi:UDP-N-acetylglucosamine 2-epimerase